MLQDLKYSLFLLGGLFLLLSCDSSSDDDTLPTISSLPTLYVDTDEMAVVEDVYDYVGAMGQLVENGKSSFKEHLGIRGRGNTTWSAPKKPYRLKFDNKVSPLGMSPDKSWVLLANYYDPTMLRTEAATYLSSISNLEFTPRFYFIDFVLNGVYNGVYQIGDKVQKDKRRVNVGDNGFLMEIDYRASSSYITIRVPHIDCPVLLHPRSTELTDEEGYNYISNFMNEADAHLFADDFTDPENGWQKYLDMDSFVDWYLINEIAKNNDAVFFSSCYMSLKRGGKLKMGPVWDFDSAFGGTSTNNTHLTEGLWIANADWYARLFEDPAFVARVKERFAHFYSSRSALLQMIDTQSKKLEEGAIRNEKIWHRLSENEISDEEILRLYRQEVDYLKDWIQRRFEWLNTEFAK